MCGLSAIFNYMASAPPIDHAELLRIREAMVKRGPEGAGLWISEDKRIGLAHRRLAILDLSEAGAQPMATPDGLLRIVFNGEIYNFIELRKALEVKGYRFRSHSDTEVLLYLYRAYGVDMVHHLRGMYAFALWDESLQTLFMARDPFGIKPLYYADDGNTLRVASQVKALLKGGCIDRHPEPAGHVGFYLWGHVPEPYTLYKGVRALPAGTIMSIDAAGRKQIRPFFNIADECVKASQTGSNLAPKALKARLREALLDSVRHHLTADVPVGVFLSAGLDSATLVALAKELGIHDLDTLTLGFKEFQGTDDDEAPLAECVAAHYATRHHSRWLLKEDFQNECQNVLDAMDQPSIDGVNSYFVSQAAADIGLKVMLSGVGGDELFGGYSSFRQIPRMVKTLGVFQSMPFLAKGFRYVAAPVLKHFTSPKYAGLLEYGGRYSSAYLLRRCMTPPWELPDFLEGEMVRQGWLELQVLSRLDQTIEGVQNVHLKVSALETAWYMRNQLLRDADWASMAHSLELRTPLVDIELFRATAPLFYASHAPTKRDMAQASDPPLPDQILRRRKTGFSIPVRKWLLDAGEREDARSDRGLKPWADRVIRNIAVES